MRMGRVLQYKTSIRSSLASPRVS